jgi:hypothetical protein
MMLWKKAIVWISFQINKKNGASFGHLLIFARFLFDD